MGQRPGRKYPICIKVFVSEDDFATLKAAAEAADSPLSAWAREMLTKIAEGNKPAPTDPIPVRPQKRGCADRITQSPQT